VYFLIESCYFRLDNTVMEERTKSQSINMRKTVINKDIEQVVRDCIGFNRNSLLTSFWLVSLILSLFSNEREESSEQLLYPERTSHQKLIEHIICERLYCH
jgi:hypothetical protein